MGNMRSSVSYRAEMSSCDGCSVRIGRGDQWRPSNGNRVDGNKGSRTLLSEMCIFESKDRVASGTVQVDGEGVKGSSVGT